MGALRTLLGEFLTRLGAVQAQMLLGIVYWTVVGVTKAILRLSGRRLLPDTFGAPGSHWIIRTPAPRDLDSFSRQY